VPRIRERIAQHGHACECAWRLMVTMNALLQVDGFVLDDMRVVYVERATVHIDVDLIDWKCDRMGV
jgi:hypothetical protein